MKSKPQFAFTWIFVLTTCVALLVGVASWAQQSRDAASIYVWLAPILVALALIFAHVVKGHSFGATLFSGLVAASASSVLVGALFLGNVKALDLLDPGRYYLSWDVWLLWFLPFHCVVSAIFASIVFGVKRAIV